MGHTQRTWDEMTPEAREAFRKADTVCLRCGRQVVFTFEGVGIECGCTAVIFKKLNGLDEGVAVVHAVHEIDNLKDHQKDADANSVATAELRRRGLENDVKGGVHDGAMGDQ